MFKHLLHIIRSDWWCIMLGLPFLAGCGTETTPALQTEISEVEVTPNPITTNYTAVFTAALSDSVNQPYRIHWQWQQSNETTSDTTTETTRLYWTAPPQPGTYEHTAWVETPEGRPLSKKYSFPVSITSWDPPSSNPSLSGKIIFSALVDEQYHIFRMNADGSNLRQLTDFASPYGNAYAPSWSPDGTQIVFASSRNGSAHTPALWVMDADGGNPHLLAPGSPFPLLGNYPRWSPEGDKIVYSYYDGLQTDIYVYDRTTEENIRLTRHPADDGFPAWSPFGYRIAFRSDREYARDEGITRNQREVYIMNANGSNTKRATTDFSGGFIWMRSDKIIITETDRNTRLKDVFILNTETRNREYIFKQLEVKSQLWAFWDRKSQYLTIINKNHNQLPVILTFYDINGNLLDQLELNIDELSSAAGFNWYFDKKTH